MPVARVKSRRKKFMSDLRARGELLNTRNAGALARLLYDEVTDLPTVPLLLGRIREMLKESQELGLLSISILQNERMEQTLGGQGFEFLVKDIASFLVEIKKEKLRREDHISEVMISGNAFVILLAPPRGQRQVAFEDIDKVRRRVGASLRNFVRDRLPASVQERFGFYVGCTVLTHDASLRFERRVYSALEEAFTDSLQQKKREQRQNAMRLKDVLKTGAVHAVYQPVVDLAEKRTIGYEALTRLSKGHFQGPDELFKVAYESDSIWKLDRLCRERAIRGAREFGADKLLFLNMEPDSIHDPDLRSDATREMLRASSLSPGQIVLELTEHSEVHDHAAFRTMLQHFHGQGFRMAMDDVGSGYSGLRSIAELRPDFIKIDMALIRDIHLHSIKQDLTATITRFSVSSGITLIAEGVETVEELRCLQSIGVRYAQGYLFARPGPAFPEADFGVIG